MLGDFEKLVVILMPWLFGIQLEMLQACLVLGLKWVSAGHTNPGPDLLSCLKVSRKISTQMSNRD